MSINPNAMHNTKTEKKCENITAIKKLKCMISTIFYILFP